MTVPATVEMTGQAILVMTNVPDIAAATSLAHILVEQRLAACVNILPAVKSVYQWQGKVEQAEEVSLLIKTTQARYPELEADRYDDENRCYRMPQITNCHEWQPAIIAYYFSRPAGGQFSSFMPSVRPRDASTSLISFRDLRPRFGVFRSSFSLRWIRSPM